VTLAWDPSPDSAVAGYHLYDGIASLTYTNVIDVGNATNATVSGLVGGVTYFFAATAYDTNGQESVFSDEVSYTVPRLINSLPTYTCGSNRTVEVGTAWDFDTPIATGTNATVTVVGTVTNLGCGESFSATRTWVVSDALGNIATCSQTVTVVDTTPPIISCAADRTVIYGSDWTFDTPTARDAGVVDTLVYDNSVHDLLYRFDPGSMEVGNEIILAGSARYASEFSFEFWGASKGGYEFEGDVQARVRFYQNDGPFNSSGYASPGTVIYDSGLFPIPATPAGRATLIFDDFQIGAVVPLMIPLPNSFTWTVQFSGLSANDSAGVDLYAPPVIGNTYGDYWENDTSRWALKTNSVPMEFAARLSTINSSATVTVLSTVTNADCGNGFSATRTWQASDVCGNIATCSQTVRVVDQGPPVIISQPQDVAVAAGQACFLEVSVRSCPPLGYQWCFNQTNVVVDATNATLVLRTVVPGDAGSYTVVVTNEYGSVTSVPASVVVIASAPDTRFRVGDGSARGTAPLHYSVREPAAALLVGGTISHYVSTGVVQAQDYTYTTNNGTITLTAYAGPGGAVEIPNAMNGLPVISIERGAFRGCSNLTSVTIGNSVTFIADSTFYQCTNLKGVYFKGNAPGLGDGVFDGDTGAAVYYLPGTTGWGTTFGGRPTAPWVLSNPLILNSGPSYGVKSNRFGFIISWATNIAVTVEASSTLANSTWAPISTNTLINGQSYFSDPQWTNHPSRFYRLRWP
jgi:hypothetical protein